MKNYTNLKFFMNMASVGVVRLSLPATQILLWPMQIKAKKFVP